ncbi:MAG: rod shape-determining protein MreD [Gemmatimonadetes bacterium]|nr:rod shape-determining protein MreD [Gemmatimonadota bacterium]
MSSRRGRRYREGAVLSLLVVSHFALLGWLGDQRVAVRVAPDLMFLALLVYSIRTTPGRASVAGFIVGLVSDALTPVAFGSGALAHTVVAYLAAWGKAVFFAENVLVSAGFFFGGVWVRDLLVLLSGGYAGGSVLVWQLVWWSPLKAVATAISGVTVLLVFRRWLEVRFAE